MLQSSSATSESFTGTAGGKEGNSGDQTAGAASTLLISLQCPFIIPLDDLVLRLYSLQWPLSSAIRIRTRNVTEGRSYAADHVACNHFCHDGVAASYGDEPDTAPGAATSAPSGFSACTKRTRLRPRHTSHAVS